LYFNYFANIPYRTISMQNGDKNLDLRSDTVFEEGSYEETLFENQDLSGNIKPLCREIVVTKNSFILMPWARAAISSMLISKINDLTGEPCVMREHLLSMLPLVRQDREYQSKMIVSRKSLAKNNIDDVLTETISRSLCDVSSSIKPPYAFGEKLDVTGEGTIKILRVVHTGEFMGSGEVLSVRFSMNIDLQGLWHVGKRRSNGWGRVKNAQR